jgi:antitoxin HicB
MCARLNLRISPGRMAVWCRGSYLGLRRISSLVEVQKTKLGTLLIFAVQLQNSGRMRDSFMNFRVIIEPEEDGIFVAECPALPGCVSQGHTRDEAIANIREAIQGYLRSQAIHNEHGSNPVGEEIIEIVVS